ncbi:MAG: glycosyltransferase 87 family protein [Gordonia sp. (in: high G+C Gram-positive bacteria)]|uniref:glycosyltransferase 87 family protein n=1 Tax=Gordonia sp. (in: high G+C Gram-positive bacteria) TaxID=84139 RepID=UPI0039E26EC2
MRYRSMWATALLAASVLGRILWITLSTNGANFVDLRVYRGGAAGLPDQVYNFEYNGLGVATPLPFTYPPFAAVVLYPLSLLPWDVVAWAWQAATIAALYGSIVLALRLCGRTNGGYPVAAAWTAVAIWCEPVRETLDYGQINVFLMLGTLAAIRWAGSRAGEAAGGALIGLMAAIKLTPAISAVWYLAVRKPLGALAAALSFGTTLLGCLLFFPDITHKYFGELIGDADRIGEPERVMNQSLRGALSRVVGSDVGTGALWMTAVAVAVVVAVAAWRAIPRPATTGDDWLATLLIVQLLGLLVSPISWVHHWVWLVPLAIWLWYGSGARRRGGRALAIIWAAVGILGVPWLLRQAEVHSVSLPHAVDVVGGAVWPLLALITLGWLALTGSTDEPSPTGADDVAPATAA